MGIQKQGTRGRPRQNGGCMKKLPGNLSSSTQVKNIIKEDSRTCHTKG